MKIYFWKLGSRYFATTEEGDELLNTLSRPWAEEIEYHLVSVNGRPVDRVLVTDPESDGFLMGSLLRNRILGKKKRLFMGTKCGTDSDIQATIR